VVFVIKYIKTLTLALIFILIVTYANDYVLDKVHSSIVFTIKNYAQLGIPTIGRFKDFEGKLYLDKEDFKKSYVNIKINVKSLDTGDEVRDKHLLGEEFFNVEKYPTIEFYSTSITPLLPDNSQFILKGKLKMLDKEKELVTYVKKEQEGKNFRNQDVIVYFTQFSINRSEFSMDKYVPMIDDKVDVNLYLEFIKK